MSWGQPPYGSNSTSLIASPCAAVRAHVLLVLSRSPNPCDRFFFPILTAFLESHHDYTVFLFLIDPYGNQYPSTGFVQKATFSCGGSRQRAGPKFFSLKKNPLAHLHFACTCTFSFHLLFHYYFILVPLAQVPIISGAIGLASRGWGVQYNPASWRKWYAINQFIGNICSGDLKFLSSPIPPLCSNSLAALPVLQHPPGFGFGFGVRLATWISTTWYHKLYTNNNNNAYINNAIQQCGRAAV